MLTPYIKSTISHIANSIHLELQKDITIAILILQTIFSNQTCIVECLRCDSNLIKNRLKLNRFFNKNFEKLIERRNDQTTDMLDTK